MIKTTVIIDHSRWKNKIKAPDNYIKRKIKKLSKFSLFKNKTQEFTIFLTNNEKIKKLNKKFRNQNKPTDVLSFPLRYIKKNVYIGDIAISFEIVNQRAKSSNFFFELDKMWIHGYFHLIGYDHKKLIDFKKMTKKENLVLNYFHKTI